MTAGEFRNLATALPEAVESAHMGHPDFRVRKKIFATLGPREAWGMVRLTPNQQSELITASPNMFEPIAGAWGAGGATKVLLETATEGLVRRALIMAWRNVAPAKMLKLLEED